VYVRTSYTWRLGHQTLSQRQRYTREGTWVGCVQVIVGFIGGVRYTYSRGIV
jgi:hypothetical protein